MPQKSKISKGLEIDRTKELKKKSDDDSIRKNKLKTTVSAMACDVHSTFRNNLKNSAKYWCFYYLGDRDLLLVWAARLDRPVWNTVRLCTPSLALWLEASRVEGASSPDKDDACQRLADRGPGTGAARPGTGIRVEGNASGGRTAAVGIACEWTARLFGSVWSIFRRGCASPSTASR
ncbi:hypothetical protein BpHYR1_033353 [Brachionus plicatilis]|uniref:Uncharacterized protein n=1 Tax=Brachionus plicatilis TaxID=10195 RepID=A0A3M7PWJ5_BRAPC|nr:hypothetical protein BpHYR1_033353 [Brachionus plicatilis]